METFFPNENAWSVLDSISFVIIIIPIELKDFRLNFINLSALAVVATTNKIDEYKEKQKQKENQKQPIVVYNVPLKLALT